MLKFTQFKKSYGGYPVLSIDNLTIKEGVYWVKGINGSGKSTLLKSIAGFFAFEGDIQLENISLKNEGANYRRTVSFAEAEPVYPEFLTGWEMIDLFKKARGGASNQERCYVESFEMESYLTNSIGTYSSGMLKKLSLVLAFLGNSKLILLDEPLITIDMDSLNVLYRWIEEKYRLENVSFLLSSHQPLDTNLLGHTKELHVENHTLLFNH